MIESPIKINNLDNNAYLFKRGDIVCSKTEDLPSIFNTISLFVNSSQSLKA